MSTPHTHDPLDIHDPRNSVDPVPNGWGVGRSVKLADDYRQTGRTQAMLKLGHAYARTYEKEVVFVTANAVFAAYLQRQIGEYAPEAGVTFARVVPIRSAVEFCMGRSPGAVLLDNAIFDQRVDTGHMEALQRALHGMRFVFYPWGGAFLREGL